MDDWKKIYKSSSRLESALLCFVGGASIVLIILSALILWGYTWN